MDIYEGNVDALKCGSYRSIRLLEHVTKVSERVIDVRLRKIVKIGNMQVGVHKGSVLNPLLFIIFAGGFVQVFSARFIDAMILRR